MKKYLVILSLVILSACSKSTTDTTPPPPPPPATPVVSFTYSINADQYPVTFNFANTSTGYTSYTWSLGNASSTATSPSGLYNTSGIKYTIKLVATNGTKTDSALNDITIPFLNKSVRMFYLIPSDKTYSQAYYDGIVNNVNTVRNWYNSVLGKTFKLNNPLIQVVNSTNPSSDYFNVNPSTTDPQAYFLYNSLNYLNILGYRNTGEDANFIYNIFVPVASGVGYGIWTIGGLRAAGVPDPYLLDLISTNTAQKNIGMGLWCHELGHSFGLNHPAIADPATIMTTPGGIQVWPVTGFLPYEKLTLLADGFMF